MKKLFRIFVCVTYKGTVYCEPVGVPYKTIEQAESTMILTLQDYVPDNQESKADFFILPQYIRP